MRYAVHIGVFIAKEMRRIMLRTKHRLLRSIAAFTAAGFLLTSTVGEAAKEPIRNAFYSGVEVLLDKQKTEPATSTTPLSFVQQGKKWGAINTAGEFVIPPEYDELTPYTSGYVSARQGKKWGVFRDTGKLIVPVMYKSIEPFEESDIVVQNTNGTWDCYDMEGNVFLPRQQRDIVPALHGISLVQAKDKSWTFYRADGTRLTEKSY